MIRLLSLPLFAIVIATLAPSATALQPFEAHYEVWLNGKRQGESTIRLERLDASRWRHRIDSAGTAGLARLAGAEARHDSEFSLIDERPRIERASVHSEAALRRREVRTAFDWEHRTARWDGDIRAGRRGPLPLEPDATTAPLLNLLLALDVATAPPGTRLTYPLFERGRVDRQEYLVGRIEPVQTPAGRFDAVPLTQRRPDRERVTTLWYAPGLPPTPVRMLRTEAGKPTYELRLTAVR